MNAQQETAPVPTKGHKFINVNLIPAEVLNAKKGGKKNAWIKTLSVGLILLIIAVTATTTIITLIQSQRLKDLVSNINTTTTKLDSLKDREFYALLLDQRLDKTTELWAYETKQEQGFDTIMALVPPDLRTLLLSVDDEGKIAFNGLTADTDVAKDMFDKLLDPGKANTNYANKLGTVKLENLNISPETGLRFEVTVDLK